MIAHELKMTSSTYEYYRKAQTWLHSITGREWVIDMATRISDPLLFAVGYNLEDDFEDVKKALEKREIPHLHCSQSRIKRYSISLTEAIVQVRKAPSHELTCINLDIL